VTGFAFELSMCALERIDRELLVIERLDLESFGNVTRVTLALGRGETKLPSMHISVAAAALTRRAAVRSSFAAPPVLLRRTVTAVAGGLRVSTGQRPDAVIDPR
jgi:hypothetical protein